MSISANTLRSLQLAGESLHAARQAFAQEVQQNASHVVGIVANEPFSNDADRAYARLRVIARMAHELQTMEEQLKTLYASAMEVVAPDVPVLLALSDRVTRTGTRTKTSSPDGAQDVVVKKAPRKALSAKGKATTAAAEPTSPTLRLSSNDEKVLTHLRQVLDRRSWTNLTQAAIAQGAGIPLGSVSLALRRVIAAGGIREGQKGSYRLT